MQINYEILATEIEIETISSLFEKLSSRIEELLQIQMDYVISVIFTNSSEIQKINRQYRNIDLSTDVISFAMLDSTTIESKEIEVELGDIFINTEFAHQQAVTYGHSVSREYAFLFVHGLLHLLGYDHLNEQAEREMFQLQDAILDPMIPREV